MIRKETFVHSGSPPLLAAIMLALAAGTTSCADRRISRKAPPEGAAVEPMQITLLNETDEEIAVPWKNGAPAMLVNQGEQRVEVQPDCHPACDEDCWCGPCPEDESMYVHIPAHGSLQYSWKPQRFILHPCQERPDCACSEAWPLGAGSYEAMIAGFSKPSPGRVVQKNPRVTVGSSRSTGSRSCSASFSFTLQHRGKARATFVCQIL